MAQALAVIERALDDQFDNPSSWSWPPTLAIEIALAAARPKAICEAYGIDREQWDAIRTNPVFISEFTSAAEALRQEGASFKVRAQMQAGELLKDIWQIMHDQNVAIAIRVDLMKFIVRVAGLDASKDQGSIFGKAGGGSGGFSLNIVLGSGNTIVGG